MLKRWGDCAIEYVQVFESSLLLRTACALHGIRVAGLRETFRKAGNHHDDVYGKTVTLTIAKSVVRYKRFLRLSQGVSQG